MAISDVIQLVGIALSFSLGIISIAITVVTVRQNNKMIEETSRPYIVVSCVAKSIGNGYVYFEVKNFGKTAAKILEFRIIGNVNDEKLKRSLKKISGLFLAPGQKRLYQYEPRSFNDREEIRFEIKYKSASKDYFDVQRVNINTGYVLIRTRPNDNEIPLHILQTLQEIAEQLV